MKKLTGITKTAPRILDKSTDFYKLTFETLNAGLEFILDSFPRLYRQTIFDLRGKFTRGELMLLIDVNNGTMLSPDTIGWSAAANAVDGIKLDRLDKKWNINGKAFVAKLQTLTIFELACLELWVQTFWNQDKHNNIEEYVKGLSESASISA